MSERPIIFTGESVRAIRNGNKTMTRRLNLKRFDVGDRLWIKETWGLRAPFDMTDWYTGSIRGLTENQVLACWVLDYRADWARGYDVARWRSPLFMPRWAAKRVVEVTAVRIERLHDMTEADAIAEGMPHYKDWLQSLSPDQPIINFNGLTFGDRPYTGSFAVKWDEINGDKCLWGSNPEVRVIEFKTVES